MAIYEIETDQGIFEVEVADSNEGMSVGKALAYPEMKSREGLEMLTEKLTPSREAIESGQVGIPGMVARTAGETLSEIAPSFVSPSSLVMGGAGQALKVAKPVMGALGKFAGSTLESTSGLGYKTPGVLGEVVEKPSLFFGKGLEKARQGYKALKDEDAIRPELKNQLLNNRSFVRKVMGIINKGESVTPDEALEARKAVDAIGDTLPDTIRKTTRKVFDLIAKQKYAEADKAYSEAVKSDAVRRFWAINKTGTPSIVKGGVSTVLPFTAPLFSPLLQGIGAAGIGAAKKLAYPMLKTSRRAIGTGAGLGAVLDE